MVGKPPQPRTPTSPHAIHRPPRNRTGTHANTTCTAPSRARQSQCRQARPNRHRRSATQAPAGWMDARCRPRRLGVSHHRNPDPLAPAPACPAADPPRFDARAPVPRPKKRTPRAAPRLRLATDAMSRPCQPRASCHHAHAHAHTPKRLSLPAPAAICIKRILAPAGLARTAACTCPHQVATDERSPSVRAS